MANNSIMIDLEDPQSEKIAEVLSNKTAKRILSLLAEKEMSGSEIAGQLQLPLNTVTYNLKNLVESGLIEKVNKVFWSSKGKRMELYKVSNKRIVITPKRMIRGIIPTVFVSVLAALGIKLWTDSKLTKNAVANMKIAEESVSGASDVAQIAAPSANMAAETAGIVGQQALAIAQSSWLWFLIGAFTALLIYLLWNWRRQ